MTLYQMSSYVAGGSGVAGPYDSWLLNELHALFPAVLYAPERFQTVGDLTRYISDQARERGNLFSRFQRQYASVHAPPARAQQRAASPVQTTERTERSPAAVRRQPIHRSVTTAENGDMTVTLESPPSSAVPARVRLHLDPAAALLPTGGMEDLIASMLGINTPYSALDSLLGPGLSSLAGLGGLGSLAGLHARTAAPTAMTPVVVRPTQSQIEQATLTFTQLSTASQPAPSCAVCQEDITDGQVIRRIRHCNHSFHRDCIDPWFERDVHCPVCRFDIREHEEAEDATASDNAH